MAAVPRTKRLTRVERMAKEAMRGVPAVQKWGETLPSPDGTSRVRTLIEHIGPDWADLLALVCECGYGLTISATRSGGALSLSLLTDAGPEKRYAGHPEELRTLIAELNVYLTQIAQGQMTMLTSG